MSNKRKSTNARNPPPSAKHVHTTSDDTASTSSDPPSSVLPFELPSTIITPLPTAGNNNNNSSNNNSNITSSSSSSVFDFPVVTRRTAVPSSSSGNSSNNANITELDFPSSDSVLPSELVPLEAYRNHNNTSIVPLSQQNAVVIGSFVKKLYEILDDAEAAPYIAWSSEGNSFVVLDSDGLAQNILPRYYKHSNFSSFVRQLNLYSFKKIGQAQHWEFKHDYFLKGQPQYLPFVKRKQNTGSDKQVRKELSALSKDKDYVLSDLSSVHRSQRNMAEIVDQLQRQNTDLWNELAQSRQQQEKTQQNLQRLMYYLMDTYGGASNGRLIGGGGADSMGRTPRLIEAPSEDLLHGLDLHGGAGLTTPTGLHYPYSLSTPTTALENAAAVAAASSSSTGVPDLASPVLPVSLPEFPQTPSTATTLNNPEFDQWMESLLEKEEARLSSGTLPPVADPPTDPPVPLHPPVVPLPSTSTNMATSTTTTSLPATGSSSSSSSSNDTPLTPQSFTSSSATAAMTMIPAGGRAITAVELPASTDDQDIQYVKESIQKLMQSMVRICVQRGYTNLLSQAGFGAWFNPQAAADPSNSSSGGEPLAVLLFPNSATENGTGGSNSSGGNSNAMVEDSAATTTSTAATTTANAAAPTTNTAKIQPVDSPSTPST